MRGKLLQRLGKLAMLDEVDYMVFRVYVYKYKIVERAQLTQKSYALRHC